MTVSTRPALYSTNVATTLFVVPRAGIEYEAALVLACAESLLVERGWTRGVLSDPVTGRYDLLGAVAAASGCPARTLFDAEFPLLHAPASRRAGALAAWDALEAELGEDPYAWNDAADRRQRDVVNLVHRVGESLYFRALQKDYGR